MSLHFSGNDLIVPTMQMTESEPCRVTESPSWLITARRLLRNLRCSHSATPTEADLSDLHISLLRDESDQLSGLHNLEVIKDSPWDPKCQFPYELARLSDKYSGSTSVETHSRYTSELLTRLIRDVGKYATTSIYEERHVHINAPIY